MPAVVYRNRPSLQTNPCEHPIVILKDVAHQELRQLLQFMYRGEVHVRQQELSGFLHTAEMLQVKGLTGGREVSSKLTLYYSTMCLLESRKKRGVLLCTLY